MQIPHMEHTFRINEFFLCVHPLLRVSERVYGGRAHMCKAIAIDKHITFNEARKKNDHNNINNSIEDKTKHKKKTKFNELLFRTDNHFIY